MSRPRGYLTLNLSLALCASMLFAGVASAQEGDAAAKAKVAVLELGANNVDAQLARTLTEVVTNQLSKIDGYQVISHADVLAILTNEQQKQLIGCKDEAACILDVSGALDAKFIVAGLIGKVGERYVLSLKLIESAKKEVVRRSERNVPQKEDILIETAKNVAYNVLTGKERATNGFVRIRVTEPDATIAVDGSSVGMSPMDDWITLKEGEHSITVQKEGFVSWSSKLDLKPEQQVELDAELIAKVDVGAESYSLDTWAWVSLGLSAAMGAGGIAAGVSAANLHGDYDNASSADEADSLRSDTESRAALANGLLFGAAGALVVTGVLFVTDLILERSVAAETTGSAGEVQSDDEAERGSRLTPVVAPNQNGVTFGGSLSW